MSRHREKRLTELETRFRTARDRACGACHGTGRFVLAVPDDAAPDDPAYLPETCPECGRPVRRLSTSSWPSRLPARLRMVG